MIVVMLLLAATVADAQVSVALACPQVSVPGNGNGTGVVIGTKDDFAYLLTAAHVIGDFDAVDLIFTSRSRYPKPDWHPANVEVLARWPDPDVALLRFRLNGHAVSVLPLAPAWQRPKTFPVRAKSIGVGRGPAATLRAETLQGKEFVTRTGKQPAFFWRTEAGPEAGRSGGPLLDGHDRVIGLAAAASGANGYYAHHDEILAGLKRAGEGWLIPKP
jgi:S1-C subfamily serine protease